MPTSSTVRPVRALIAVATCCDCAIAIGLILVASLSGVMTRSFPLVSRAYGRSWRAGRHPGLRAGTRRLRSWFSSRIGNRPADRQRKREGRALAVHGPDQAERAHVGPVLLDEADALRAGVGAVRDLPARRDRERVRPQRMLALGVHDDLVHAVIVLEGVCHPYLTSLC